MKLENYHEPLPQENSFHIKMNNNRVPRLDPIQSYCREKQQQNNISIDSESTAERHTHRADQNSDQLFHNVLTDIRKVI